MSGAIKNDLGKPDFSLIPKIAMVRLTEAMQVGERKYGRYNYTKGMEASRVLGALLRHAFAWYDGEEFDKTDGQHHLGSVMACALMILRQQELGTLIDDRFVPPAPESVPCPPAPQPVYHVTAVSKGRSDPFWVGTYLTRPEAESMLDHFKEFWPPSNYTLAIQEVPSDEDNHA